jgi:magnesium-transporting ATPase (P-type)
MATPPTPTKKTAKAADRLLLLGLPDLARCDNRVISARYSALTFLPKAIMEQFRRFANIYFLTVGCIMAIGYYTDAFDSAVSPWTTLGPLAVVVSFSLLVEGNADYKRHKNDAETNNAPCTILTRADELPKQKKGKNNKNAKSNRDEKIMNGKDTIVNINKDAFRGSKHPMVVPELVSPAASPENRPPKSPLPPLTSKIVKIAYQKVPRQDIRQGHFVLVKNREMVPADIVLLASSNDQGSAYIETSSIDGETNLKLRISPTLPKEVLKYLKDGVSLKAIEEEDDNHEDDDDDDHQVRIETIQEATKRLARLSYLGHPQGKSVMEHEDFKDMMEQRAQEEKQRHEEEGGFNLYSLKRFFKKDSRSKRWPDSGYQLEEDEEDSSRYIAALTTEPPNASVHTFGGCLTLPPFKPNGRPLEIPLDAENVLLRGAVVRNTEWVIGVAFFTGTDSKLVQNSFETKSKFSQLDRLMNMTVVAILCVMIGSIIYLASMATVTNINYFDQLFYIGFNKDTSEPWPYLPNLAAPEWQPNVQNWLQYFFMYVTLLTNFVPLSLYITVEFITFTMLWFIYVDLDMYDDTTNTRALAKSTIVTDLGRIQYIFSDKTGTLTQNVMRFKRCSVDGMVFGAPIQKNRPKSAENESGDDVEEEEDERSSFYPLRQLLVGQFRTPRSLGLEGLGGATAGDASGFRNSPGNMLTFNAEMFLRVLSLCHTVVVEKDIDKKDGISGGASTSSTASRKSWFGNRKRTNTGDSGLGLSVVSEDHEMMIDESEGGIDFNNRMRSMSVNSLPPGQTPENTKSADGAPYGFAYQAESPDEGALVSAASTLYGFQVTSRDSSGIRLKLTSPSHLRKQRVVSGLKSGELTLKRLAAETASEVDDSGEQADKSVMDSVLAREPMEETWTILAVNKFDSDRKRMSILLRSPPELGNLPILFCKGADSNMLESGVCASSVVVDENGSSRPISEVGEGEDEADTQEWEVAQILGLQAHLGEFASEGLRTLVLGMRVLGEDECSKWIEQYKAAASSMQNRAEKLTAAAVAIEHDLHIVGATAIEDKLQTNVPETIATLAKAGIKLWVLTGDKRETAVEIGYSTAVLTPKMHLTEVPDNGKKYVATQMAMEFIRLVKMGKLAEYQKSALDDTGIQSWSLLVEDWLFELGKFNRFVKRTTSEVLAWIQDLIGLKRRAARRREDIAAQLEEEKRIRKPVDKRRKVRKRAEKIIQQWLDTEVGTSRKNHRGGYPSSDDDLSLASEETPGVFNRAQSAKTILKGLKSDGGLTAAQLRENSMQQLTVHESGSDENHIVDEDALSMDSFAPNGGDITGDYDKKRRTVLERLFAIDRDVRKGKLTKHLTKSKLAAIQEHAKPKSDPSNTGATSSGPRALVIEGGALKHLLGDPVLEDILFAVASNCDAVIACRASPKQKAMLLNLVRKNISPEPITLAIGDGANDVGMIQEVSRT